MKPTAKSLMVTCACGRVFALHLGPVGRVPGAQCPSCGEIARDVAPLVADALPIEKPRAKTFGEAMAGAQKRMETIAKFGGFPGVRRRSGDHG